MGSKEKFLELLKKIFQFDTADIDFGIYNFLNFKKRVAQHWIENTLLKVIELELAKLKKNLGQNSSFKSLRGYLL